MSSKIDKLKAQIAKLEEKLANPSGYQKKKKDEFEFSKEVSGKIDTSSDYFIHIAEEEKPKVFRLHVQVNGEEKIVIPSTQKGIQEELKEMIQRAIDFVYKDVDKLETFQTKIPDLVINFTQNLSSEQIAELLAKEEALEKQIEEFEELKEEQEIEEEEDELEEEDYDDWEEDDEEDLEDELMGDNPQEENNAS